MEEEEAVDNVTAKEEKRVKKNSKKGKENEGSAVEIQEAHSIGTTKAVERNPMSEKEDIAEMKDRKRDKEKKINKVTKDAAAEIKKSAEEGELTVAYGRDGSGDAKDYAERKSKKEDKNESRNNRIEMGNANAIEGNESERLPEEESISGADSSKGAGKERKRKKEDKNESRNNRIETGNSNATEGNESEKLPKGESISGADSSKGAGKERKKKKAKRSHEDRDAEEGETVGTDSRNCEIHIIEDVERKKRKKEKKRSKDDKNRQDNFCEAKHDEGDLTSQLENVSGNRIDMRNTNAIEGNESEKLPGEESISGANSNKDAGKERKKKKSKRTHEDRDAEEGDNVGTDSRNSEIHVIEDVEKKKSKKEKKRSKDDNNRQDNDSEAKHDEGDLTSQLKNMPDNVEGKIQSTEHDGKTTKELKRKKKSEKKENSKHDSSAAQQDALDKDTNHPVHSDEIQYNELENANKRKKKKKKKKTKLVENPDNTDHDEVEYADKGKREKNKSVESGPNDPTPSKSNKKVRFSDQDEVFPLPDEDLVRGKRFTPEEDEIVKEAVLRYITEHDLGDEGLNKVLNCRKNPEVRGCWKEIGSAIPYRPYTATYYRAHILFQRSEHRKWTKEEYEEILKYQEEHGNEWKAIADELGKHRFHVKDTWRRIKLRNMNKGHWKQEEYQQLFDLVNTDLQAKIFEAKRSKHGMLRDNICWTVISDQLSTRAQANCCVKWYKQLTSPMVAEGIWADTDDYRMIGALYTLDAACMEDVDWDDLVEGRGGDVCRKRWNQMALHLGKNGRKSFAEQVEVLAERYCPHLLEARETWDSKPRVP